MEHAEDDEDLWGFIVKTAVIELAPLNPPFTNLEVEEMLKKQGHFPGITLAKVKSFVSSPPRGCGKKKLFRLRYKPTKEELCDYIKKRVAEQIGKQSVELPMVPLHS